MNGSYQIVKLNKVKLVELCSDAEVYSWRELARKCGLSLCAISNAFNDADGHVSITTAAKIAQYLGEDVSAFGDIETISKRTIGADFYEAYLGKMKAQEVTR